MCAHSTVNVCAHDNITSHCFWTAGHTVIYLIYRHILQKTSQKKNTIPFTSALQFQFSDQILTCPSACPQSCDSEWLLTPILRLPDAEVQA